MAEEQFTQGKTVLTGDDVTCPNCGSHNVYCVPYPKVEFGIWFFSVADRCVRRLYALSACHDSGYCFLEHRIGDPAETKQAGKAVYPDEVHHLRNKF